MKKHFSYLPYSGVGDYAYFGCGAVDEPIAAEVLEILAVRGFNFSCDSIGSKLAETPEHRANSIANCSGAVIFLSEKSIEALGFRNAINYLLSLRKPLICVKIGNFKLGHGLDMQLANIPMISYDTADGTAEDLLQSGVLTYDMVGEPMERVINNRKRTYIILGMFITAIIIFALSVGAVIKKHNSAEYILSDADGSAYVNIAQFGDDGLTAMSGKSVDELDLSGGEYSSLTAIKNVSAKTVNVSDISPELALWPLTQVKGIETVKISQDQVIYGRELCNAGLSVVVTH